MSTHCLDVLCGFHPCHFISEVCPLVRFSSRILERLFLHVCVYIMYILVCVCSHV